MSVFFINREKSPTQKVLDEVRQQLIAQAHTSSNLTDFTFSHLAHGYLDTENFSWKMMGKDYSLQSVMHVLSEAATSEVTVDAETIEQGIPAPSSSDIAVVLLKRIRKPDTTYSTRALVSLPHNAQFRNIFFLPEQIQSDRSVLYFHPMQRCTEHALDDLYKAHRDAHFEIPYKSPDYIQSLLKRDPRTGVVEYVIDTPQGKIKQDPIDLLLGGVQQIFSNDPVSMLVSEYLFRNNISV